ncbi:hypothetical protein [Candidatus Thiothrix anitrata]|uniref:Transposase DDE domain-containing protein n=1 Tax=Candidatus Thiothrix anitrata TaxID=2823902 RepID=A0ABX7X4X7_9GAMM|nr:hypothetical protein [Candidatus Thiothrix anitrata]QTR50932.1 hypothetical protein J8380_05025 [Candidatus Thiothrix anitrata]
MALCPLLRAVIGDVALQATIRKALWLKPLAHNFNQAQTQVLRFMSITGG